MLRPLSLMQRHHLMDILRVLTPMIAASVVPLITVSPAGNGTSLPLARWVLCGLITLTGV